MYTMMMLYSVQINALAFALPWFCEQIQCWKQGRRLQQLLSIECTGRCSLERSSRRLTSIKNGYCFDPKLKTILSFGFSSEIRTWSSIHSELLRNCTMELFFVQCKLMHLYETVSLNVLQIVSIAIINHNLFPFWSPCLQQQNGRLQEAINRKLFFFFFFLKFCIFICICIEWAVPQILLLLPAHLHIVIYLLLAIHIAFLCNLSQVINLNFLYFNQANERCSLDM